MSTAPKRVTFKSEDDVYIYPKADSVSRYLTPPPSSDEEGGSLSPDITNNVERSLGVEMSEAMERSLRHPWDVSTKLAPRYATKPALADSDVDRLLLELKPCYFTGEIVVTLHEGASFIAVGDIYNAIDKHLDTTIKATDSIFTDQGTQVQREILATFERRTRSKFAGYVQLVDFLQKNRFLERISVDNVSERWMIRFGTGGDD